MAQRVLVLGPWLCMAVLSLWANGLSGQNEVDISLRFAAQPQDIIAKKGSPALFNCTATSTESGSITVSWFKNGNVVTPNDRVHLLRNGSLYISKVQHRPRKDRSDEGYYVCNVTNSVGTLYSHRATLQVASIRVAEYTQPLPPGPPGPSGPRTPSSSPGLTAREGDVVYIHCPVTGTPHPRYRWSKDQTSIPLSQPRPPYRRRAPANTNIYTTASPTGRTRQTNHRYVLLPSGALEINGVTRDEAGTYRCSATNVAGRRTAHNITLTVLHTDADGGVGEEAAARIITEPQNITKQLGSIAVMECAASGVPIPSITWTRQDGAPVDEMLADGRFAIIGQGSLAIQDVQLGDAGTYSCAAHNLHSSRPAITQSTLNVIAPPVIYTEPHTLVWRSVKTIRFMCVVESGTPSPAVTWLRNGREIPSQGRFLIDGPELRISQGDVVDNGLYQCRAENKAGVAMANARLLVQPESNAPNPPTNLRAAAVSADSIDVFWTPPILPPGTFVIGYSLHYRDVAGGAELQVVVSPTETQKRLEGLSPFTTYSIYAAAYTTRAHSGHSLAVETTTFESVPTGVPQCALQPLGATSMKVTWEPLERHVACGVIVAYKIYYRKLGAQSITVETVPGTETTYVITGLDAEETYEVRVAGATAVGAPNFSDERWPWVILTTVEAAPPGAPRPPVLDGRAVNSTAIFLTWQPVSSPQHHTPAPSAGGVSIITSTTTAPRGVATGSVGGGSGDGYTLWYNQPGGMENRVDLPADATQYLLNDLAPNQWYDIRLQVHTSGGESEPAVKSIKTLPDTRGIVIEEPIPRPTNIQATALDSSAIAVQWRKPPLLSATVDMYSVRCVKLDEQGHPVADARPVEIHSESLMATVTSLEPYTLYELSVRARTLEGYSPYSKAVTCWTKEDRPSAPEHAEAETHEPGVIQLRWSPPKHKNGIIISYAISYSVDKEMPETFWYNKRENGSVTITKVENLQDDTVYYFKLRAETRAGQGEATALIAAHTAPNADGEPGGDTSDLGIIIGVIIGGSCIIVCAICIIVMFKNRCFGNGSSNGSRTSHSSPPAYTANGYPGHGMMSNGHSNGYHTPLNDTLANDSIQPMLTPLTDNPESDTKGGSDISRSFSQTPTRDMRTHYHSNGHVSTHLMSPASSLGTAVGGGGSITCGSTAGSTVSGGDSDHSSVQFGSGGRSNRHWSPSLSGASTSSAAAAATRDGSAPLRTSTPHGHHCSHPTANSGIGAGGPHHHSGASHSPGGSTASAGSDISQGQHMPQPVLHASHPSSRSSARQGVSSDKVMQWQHLSDSDTSTTATPHHNTTSTQPPIVTTPLPASLTDSHTSADTLRSTNSTASTDSCSKAASDTLRTPIGDDEPRVDCETPLTVMSTPERCKATTGNDKSAGLLYCNGSVLPTIPVTCRPAGLLPSDDGSDRCADLLDTYLNTTEV